MEINNLPDYRDDIIKLLKSKRYSILSDDLDGYLSSLIALNYFNIEPVGFFSPKLFTLKRGYDKEQLIGLDMTLDNTNIKLKTISNHVEKYNKDDRFSNSITCNSHIYYNNYHEKSLFSTTLMLWVSLGLPLPDSEVGKMLLLSIDSTYKQYYAGDKFRKIIERDLKRFGVADLIYTLENNTEEDFECIRDTYRVYEDIKPIYNKGEMIISINNYSQQLPLREICCNLGLNYREYTLRFKRWLKLKRGNVDSSVYKMIRENNKNVFSFAMPYKRSINFSYVDKIVDNK